MTSTNKAIKISLSLALMVFVLTMTPASTFIQITKPAEAAPLTSIKISPTNNIVNTRTTYDIFFVTATTGTIKFIHMIFPSGFDVTTTTLIERSGIGTGSISTPSTKEVIYSVTNPVSVPAGTVIRLQIAKILNSNTEGNFRLTIATQDANNAIIDGFTNSFSFPIKSITGNDILDNSVTGDDILDNSVTGNDISPLFMLRKTLKDDNAGHAKGWDPGSGSNLFTITDADVKGGTQDSIFIAVQGTDLPCHHRGLVDTVNNRFQVSCSTFGPGGSIVNPPENMQLHYVITRLPANVVTSSLSAPSSPFDSSSESQNVFPPSLP